MSRLLSTIISDRPGQKSAANVLLVQSSAAQSAIPVVSAIVRKARSNERDVVLVRALYPLQTLEGTASSTSNVKHVDWTLDVPGYGAGEIDWAARLAEVKGAIDSCQSTTVVFDSIDTLEDDYESPSKAYKFLVQVLAHLRARQLPFTLVLHLTLHSNVLPLLQQPSFTSSLVHISAHPPALLTYIASEFLTPPPSSSSSSSTDPATLKFWNIFIPLTQRNRTGEVESLVFGQRDRPGGTQDEIVLEVLTRSHSGELSTFGGTSAAIHKGNRRRAVDRVLEGWQIAKGEPCKLEDLVSLKSVWRQNVVVEQDAPDPTKNLTFNLSLTESQQNSKSKVPLPYEHENSTSVSSRPQTSQILYDPDSADDLDDEDPDEDLDI
ncbi:hypothetical protein SCHPADRAFT_965750 [Schizopora paradoxa]|uniref:Elongator complex protein 5 n=1 Tax=Schizopora paradoxa TaxID=27342 RepID=A0A0H2RY87_9AGAM|nr:hypothetical protein SCHPADRAFT_965750 [Schizopora paradoxa]